MECWEPTFVAYFFEEDKTYPPFCYPTDYKPDDREDDTVYGLIQNIDEARAYNLTFDPYFYTPDAAVRYRQSTYEDTEQDQGNDEDENDESDENIRGIWESDDEDTTEPNKTAEHMETDSKEKPPQQETKKTNNTEKRRSKPKQKTQPNPSQPSPTQTPKPSDSAASNQSPDLKPPTRPNPPQVPETRKKNPQTATKRKLTTNSPKVEQKKTEDTSATNKDSTSQEPTVVINGKACVQMISLEASHSLKYLLVNKSGRVGLPAIEEQAQKLGQDDGCGQDIARLVLSKVGGKICAYFTLLKRGQINPQLIHDVRHILGQCKWAQ